MDFALIPSSVKTKRLNSVDALDYNLTLDDSEVIPPNQNFHTIKMVF